MVADTIQVNSNQEAVLSAAEEVVTRAAMEASLEQITERPRQIFLRDTRSWWGRDARRTTVDNSNVVWCRAKR